jgi:hypothetical protein
MWENIVEPNRPKISIQGVSRGIVNILGGGSMDYSEYKNSYKHVSIFQWVWKSAV